MSLYVSLHVYRLLWLCHGVVGGRRNLFCVLYTCVCVCMYVNIICVSMSLLNARVCVCVYAN